MIRQRNTWPSSRMFRQRPKERQKKTKMRSRVIDIIECVVFWFISLSQTHVYWSIVSHSHSPFAQGSMGQLCIYLKWTDDGTGRFTYTQLSPVHKQIKSLTDPNRRNDDINFLSCIYLSEKRRRKSFKLDLTFCLKILPVVTYSRVRAILWLPYRWLSFLSFQVKLNLEVDEYSIHIWIKKMNEWCNLRIEKVTANLFFSNYIIRLLSLQWWTD